MAHLSVHDSVHARVTDEGDLAYSVGPSKLRVAAASDEPAVDELAEQDEAAELAQAKAAKPGP